MGDSNFSNIPDHRISIKRAKREGVTLVRKGAAEVPSIKTH